MKPVVRRLLAACLLATGLVLVGAPSGAAAAAPDDCVKVDPTDAVQDADAVFTGVVTSVRRITRSPEDVQFGNEVQVELVYKGSINTETVTVVTRPSNRRSAGLGPLQKDERYLFIVRALPTDVPTFVAGACSGTGPAVADQVTRVEELFGAGRPAVPPAAPEASFERVADSDPADFTRSAAPGLALVLVGLLGLVVVRRLGRRQG